MLMWSNDWLLPLPLVPSQGLAEAQASLADCLFHGIGCQRSPTAATPWLRAAAAHGSARAQVR